MSCTRRDGPDVTLAPPPHGGAIKSMLSDPARPAHAQVATVADGKPQVRTVRLFYAEPPGCLSFSTSTLSSKWSQLKADPALAGCLLDRASNVQYRFWGAADLVEAGTRGGDDLIAWHWRRLSPALRATAWVIYNRLLGLQSEALDVEAPCPGEAVVLCRPTRWDIFKLDSPNFDKSWRRIARLENGSWTVSEAPIWGDDPNRVAP